MEGGEHHNLQEKEKEPSELVGQQRSVTSGSSGLKEPQNIEKP